jgi:aerobic-type carbon monoxide dehydrogenase small subunit (CoxS/CutS family)
MGPDERSKPGRATSRLRVNGVDHLVALERDRSLLFVLREELGLTGTKYGCGEGECGACKVLVDGVAVRSCMTPVAEAVGRSVTTIEGLAEGERLHPVQQAFLETGAFQCGFCIPGMIIGAASLLSHNPRPTDEEVRAGMDGNVCRCGGYPRILEAIRRAATLEEASGGRSP